MTDLEQAAALSPPGWSDANDLDDRVQQLPGAGQAVAELWLDWADKLAEDSGLTHRFPEALREAATAVSAAAQELDYAIGGGIMNSQAYSWPEARASLPPLPERYQGMDPRKLVLGKYLADKNPHAGDGPRRTG